MRVALVVGHDEKKKGVRGSAGLYEWEYNKKLLEFIAPLLNELNIKAKMFYRNPNIMGYTKKMIELHNRIDTWGAKVSIEFHFNASNIGAKGHEVLYCKYSKYGKSLAKILNDKLSILGNHNRGIKAIYKPNDRGRAFLCRGRSICLIAEPFFAIEQKEFMPNTQGWQNLAGAYIDGVLDIVKTLNSDLH